MLINFTFNTFLIMLMTLLVLIIAHGLIIAYLVNKKKIKSNRYTRFIYMDNYSIVEEWPKIKCKGVFQYIIKFIMYYLITIVVLNIISIYIFRNTLSESHIGTTIAMIIGTSIGGYFNWCRMEDRYNRYS